MDDLDTKLCDPEIYNMHSNSRTGKHTKQALNYELAKVGIHRSLGPALSRNVPNFLRSINSPLSLLPNHRKDVVGADDLKGEPGLQTRAQGGPHVRDVDACVYSFFIE